MGNYSGIALPWDGTLAQFVTPKSDTEVLRSSVLWILLTRLGERVMLPEFGSDVANQLFEPNDDVSRNALEFAVQEAVEKWDPRIEFQDVEITQDESKISVRVRFKNREDPLGNLAEVEVTVNPDLL